MSPYLVLGVARNADDQTIRRAYLDMVRQATPESDPERFKAVAAAYDLIKDETCRRRYELMPPEVSGSTPVEVLITHLQTVPRPGPLSYESLKEFLRVCSKT